MAQTGLLLVPSVDALGHTGVLGAGRGLPPETGPRDKNGNAIDNYQHNTLHSCALATPLSSQARRAARSCYVRTSLTLLAPRSRPAQPEVAVRGLATSLRRHGVRRAHATSAHLSLSHSAQQAPGIGASSAAAALAGPVICSLGFLLRGDPCARPAQPGVAIRGLAADAFVPYDHARADSALVVALRLALLLLLVVVVLPLLWGD